MEAGPSGYPNIKYPTFDQDDFELIENTSEHENPKTAATPDNRNIFAMIKKRLNRKKKIFNFYCCDLCGNYCTFSSKGFRSHRMTVHKIGVLKERNWDRFGHPFEPPETEIPPPSQIKPEDLDEQRQLEWALKESALMYAAK
ncbi:uncharacterized protein TNCT_709991 [Trichonephila clavata]|uniref:Uncharacterized protein n=1 Tax=Trichonephila clavata TaxID=2740835 RepID=A0A8X6FVI8_TRICU|nr:uncharacterized protein TNCT_709991 [Trichonephila clavata]